MTTTLALTFDDVLGPQPPTTPRCGRAGGSAPVRGGSVRDYRHRARQRLRPGAAPPGQQLDLPWEPDGVDGADEAPVAARVPARAVGGVEERGSRGTAATAAASRGNDAGRAAAGGPGAAGAAGSGPRSRPPGPRRPAPRPGTVPTPRAAVGLLRQATEGVAEAHELPDPLRRYPAAYLAALRAAAAVLAVRAAPAPKRRAGRSAWSLLADVAPEFAEWAAFFASCSATRSAAEAGIARLVGQREADDLLRQTEEFVGLVGQKVVSAA